MPSTTPALRFTSYRFHPGHVEKPPASEINICYKIWPWAQGCMHGTSAGCCQQGSAGTGLPYRTSSAAAALCQTPYAARGEAGSRAGITPHSERSLTAAVTAPRSFLLRNNRRAVEKKAKGKAGHFSLHAACIPAVAQGRLSPPGEMQLQLPAAPPAAVAFRWCWESRTPWAKRCCFTDSGHVGRKQGLFPPKKKTTQWFNGAEANPTEVPSSDPCPHVK